MDVGELGVRAELVTVVGRRDLGARAELVTAAGAMALGERVGAWAELVTAARRDRRSGRTVGAWAELVTAAGDRRPGELVTVAGAIGARAELSAPRRAGSLRLVRSAPRAELVTAARRDRRPGRTGRRA